ncbi:UDP-glucose 4-epimerase GalE [Oscillospiraceae bacterium OttesenSCG-928-F05]|nr:UDP-glucose 4-epimerase GalE [Oscillospiraceae bacterium OttesenSCG-928-F05]
MILVTGGAGYIGSHAVKELLRAGYAVAVIDNLQKGHREAVLPEAAFYEGDLRDGAFLERVFGENTFEGVIHFAADSLVGESVKEPLKYYENNMVSTIRLLRKMREHGVKPLVFSSTAATYGEPERTPIEETDATVPRNTYGETKLAVEKMLRWEDEAGGVKYAALRYFNAAGADPEGELGEDHAPETHLIPNVLKAALTGESMALFGDDYPTADGTCVRDYIHVTDLVRAHVLALEKLIAGRESAIYNLGSGSGFSNKQILETAGKVCGKKVPYTVGPRRAGDPAILVASSEKIKRELGWAPEYSALETIIETAYRWHRDHPGGYRR